MCVTTINGKRGHKFRREQERYVEEFGGGREGRNVVIIISKTRRNNFLRIQNRMAQASFIPLLERQRQDLFGFKATLAYIGTNRTDRTA